MQEWTLTGLLKSPGVALLGLVVAASLGPWGLPQMVHKFYAIKDTRAIRPAVIISTVFALIMTLGAYFTGALGRYFFLDKPPILMKAGEQVMGPDGKPKIDFDAIMPIILDKALPGALLTVILLLVLSASMSTLAGLVMIGGFGDQHRPGKGQDQEGPREGRGSDAAARPDRRVHRGERGAGADSRNSGVVPGSEAGPPPAGAGPGAG